MNSTVVKLWRYPVKSMLGESCESLEVDPRGIVGDRQYAVRDRNGKLGSGKNTRRFRQIDGLLGFQASYEGDIPVVRFPDGRKLRADDSAIHGELSDSLRQPVILAREAQVAHFDAGPIHLLTTGSLAWLRGKLPDARIDERRSRPNLVIEVAGDEPVERTWLDKVLTVGDSVKLKVCASTERCVMTTLAQAELPDDDRILQWLAAEAGMRFGVYAEVLTPGRITLGDRAQLFQAV